MIEYDEILIELDALKRQYEHQKESSFKILPAAEKLYNGICAILEKYDFKVEFNDLPEDYLEPEENEESDYLNDLIE